MVHERFSLQEANENIKKVAAILGDTYPGNLHDRKQFESVKDEMFDIVCGLNKTKERLTVVIDKGINSEGNYSWIDEHSRIHFIVFSAPLFLEI